MSPASAERQLKVRKLTLALEAVLSASGARRVLVASPYRGDGKTTACEVIRRHQIRVGAPPTEIVALSGLTVAETAGRRQLVDGISLLVGSELDKLDLKLARSLQGAVLVCRGHRARRADVAACAALLADLSIPVLGVVWNEWDHPPAAELPALIRQRLRGWFAGHSRNEVLRRARRER